MSNAGWIVGGLVAIGIFAAYGSEDRADDRTDISPALPSAFASGAEETEVSGAQGAAVSDLTEQAMPARGSGTCNAWNGGRLAVTTPAGDNHYYVEMRASGDKVACFDFIPPGDTVTLGIPVGTYSFHYASGTQWYGNSDFFGPMGSYAKADETFSFQPGTGWGLRLIPQTGGNLGTNSQGYSEWAG